jgi:hypothetical protein
VARPAKKKREVTAEHDAAAREIAERADGAHGTVAAIVRRQVSTDQPGDSRIAAQTGDPNGAGDSAT